MLRAWGARLSPSGRGGEGAQDRLLAGSGALPLLTQDVSQFRLKSRFLQCNNLVFACNLGGSELLSESIFCFSNPVFNCNQAKQAAWSGSGVRAKCGWWWDQQ